MVFLTAKFAFKNTLYKVDLVRTATFIKKKIKRQKACGYG